MPQFTAQASANGTRVLTGDFDGDGRTDLAAVPLGATDNVNESLVLALSNGNGTFRQAATPESESDLVANIDGRQVTAGDFDGDGRTDLTVATRNSVLIAYSAGTNGTFTLNEAQASSTSFYTQRNMQILAGDYNCDGRDDLAAVPQPGSSSSTILIARTTDDPDMLSVTSNLPQFTQLAKTPGAKVLQGDYNNDNCADIALTGATGWTTTPTALSNTNGTLTQTNPTTPDLAAWAAGTTTPVTMPSPPATSPNGIMSLHDTEAWSGNMTSVAIGTDGLGIIAYRGGAPVGSGFAQNLRVAHCNDLACTSSTTSDIDTIGDVGLFPSIKIGIDGGL